MIIEVRVSGDIETSDNGDMAIRGSVTTYSKMSQVSDGFHTFAELYRYRMLLQAAWFNTIIKGKERQMKIVKSYRHHDGELCFGKENYFIVVAQLPTGQISNHYKGDYWDLFDVPAVETAPEWDGHTPEEAADRIEKYLEGDY